MQASLLREIIHVYAPNTERNEYGEQVQKYDFLYATKAQVSHSQGNRTQENDEVVNNYRKTFTVRSYHPLTEQLYIRYCGRFYRILSLEPVPQSDCIIVQTELVND